VRGCWMRRLEKAAQRCQGRVLDLAWAIVLKGSDLVEKGAHRDGGLGKRERWRSWQARRCRARVSRREECGVGGRRVDASGGDDRFVAVN
jgi:hypothetical protein